jgi:hypothetical protein
VYDVIELLRKIERHGEEQVKLLRSILCAIKPHDRVTGGRFTQIPSGENMAFVPIQPGNSPKFQVTPTFSGPPFPLVGAQAAISTSDPTNAPASIDLTDDPTGATFILNLTPGAVIAPGGEALTVTWSYTNTDGSVANVTGTVTEEGIVDDVTGGTFAQVA